MAESRARRPFDQSMGFWLNDPAIHEPQRIAAAMADLAASGYGIVRIMVRQTCFHHRAPAVVAAVATAVEHGHQRGLRVVLDCEPHRLVAEQIGQSARDALGWRLFRASGPLRDGAFRADLQLGDMSGITFDHVAAAVVSDDAGERVVPTPACALDWEVNMAPAGIADARQEYGDGKSFRQTRHLGLRGSIAGAGDGTIALYVAVADRQLVDFAAPETLAWFRTLVADYHHIPLDGLCWDEPAIAGDWNSYRYGRGFARRFAELNGYELAPRLHLLDAPGLKPEAVRVRLDYYRTLNESLFTAQADLIAAARAAFGLDALLGNHHTWQGEGGINDYRAGAVDYFRLNDQMDAGYTDCWWWDPASVAYSYALGSSLGRLTPSGEAECNTWHAKPTVRNTRWNARLMSLMHITWFNIWYGDDADTAMYPAHRTWPVQVETMRRHQRWQRLLGTARPVVDIAVLHDWQGVCGANRAHAANLHKAFCMNLSLRAQACSTAFDFIDARLLAASTVDGGVLGNALGRYRVLVIPGAAVLDRAAWRRVQAFAAAGGRVVFAGPPPSADETGGDLSAEFAALLAMPPLHADAYDAWFAQTGAPLPQHRPERFDLAYPLAVDPARAIPCDEGGIHGVRAPAGEVVWFSGYEASEEVLARCRSWAPAAVGCHSASVLWRLYRDGGRSLLMLVAREDAELSGIIEYAGHRLRLAGGTCACLVVEADGGARLQHDDEAARSTLARIA
jgi:hypothetical protein